MSTKETRSLQGKNSETDLFACGFVPFAQLPITPWGAVGLARPASAPAGLVTTAWYMKHCRRRIACKLSVHRLYCPTKPTPPPPRPRPRPRKGLIGERIYEKCGSFLDCSVFVLPGKWSWFKKQNSVGRVFFLFRKGTLLFAGIKYI